MTAPAGDVGALARRPVPTARSSWPGRRPTSMRWWTPSGAGDRVGSWHHARGSWHHRAAMTPAPDAPRSGARSAPTFTHGCVRCGAPVAIDVGLCERCNPLGPEGLRRPRRSTGRSSSPSLAAVVTLAIVGRLASRGMSGRSPATSSTTSFPTGEGLAVTLAVTNARHVRRARRRAGSTDPQRPRAAGAPPSS